MIGRTALHPFKCRIALRSAGLLGVCFVSLTGLLGAAPQIVSLSSGERLVGELLPQSNDQVVVLRSDFLGEVTVPRAQIVKIEPKVIPVELAEVSKPESKKSDPKSDPKDAEVAAEGKPPGRAKSAVKPETAEELAERKAQVKALEVEKQAIIEKLYALKAPEAWKGNLRMGMNLSSGDQKWTETAISGNLEVQEQGSPNFYRFSGAYVYRETEGSDGIRYKSTDRYDGSFIFRRSFTDHNWFIQNSMSARVDEIKGIDHEVQELIGGGYKIEPSDKLVMLVGGSAGLEDYLTTDDDSRNGVNQVLNVFQEITWKPFSRTSFVQKFNYYWEPDYTERYNYVLSAAVRIRLTDLLGFEFSYNQNYDNDIGNGSEKNEAVWRNALIVYF
jgi:hypothetical protein